MKSLLELYYQSIREQQQPSTEFDDKIKHIQDILKQEMTKYNNDNYDDRWVGIREELRRIDGYFEDGYFLRSKDDTTPSTMAEFLNNLDYSTSHTYKKGEQVRRLPVSNRYPDGKNSDMPVYRAIGNKTLFRGVSLKDWKRIKRQGCIDSDMRGAIMETEGINLGQTPSTAEYYLPHNDSGIILAISPKNLDLYMLSDEYIRVFEPIPIDNVIKVSGVFIKNKVGSTLNTDTGSAVNNMIDRLKKLGITIH